MVQKIPPPPPLGINDQPLNRWLIELQNIINGGGAIDATAVTQPPGTNNTTIATTAFVLANSASSPSTTVPLVDATPGQVGTSTHFARGDHQHPTDTSRAALASPTFTGTPAAPTPTVGDNTTKLATTAFVLANSGQPGAAVPLPDTGTGAVGVSPFYSRQDHVHPGGAVLNGSGVPAAGLGNNGDLYLNNTGGGGTRLYGKIAGAWVAVA